MADFDMIVRGGTVATASDVFDADVGIRDGRIAALGRELGTADEIVDASGKLVLPGGIDSHVHIAQPSGENIIMADDFESGTRSAAFGGNTLVMPFCLQEKGKGLREALSGLVYVHPGDEPGLARVETALKAVVSKDGVRKRGPRGDAP